MAGHHKKLTTHQLNKPNKVLCIAKYQLLIVSLLYNRKKRNPEREKINRTLNIKKEDDNKINSELRPERNT